MKTLFKIILGLSYIINASGFITAWYVPGEPPFLQVAIAIVPGILFCAFYDSL